MFKWFWTIFSLGAPGERKGLDWDRGEYHAAVATLRVEATDIFPDIGPFRTPAH